MNVKRLIFVLQFFFLVFSSGSTSSNVDVSFAYSNYGKQRRALLIRIPLFFKRFTVKYAPSAHDVAFSNIVSTLYFVRRYPLYAALFIGIFKIFIKTEVVRNSYFLGRTSLWANDKLNYVCYTPFRFVFGPLIQQYVEEHGGNVKIELREEIIPLIENINNAILLLLGRFINLNEVINAMKVENNDFTRDILEKYEDIIEEVDGIMINIDDIKNLYTKLFEKFDENSKEIKKHEETFTNKFKDFFVTVNSVKDNLEVLLQQKGEEQFKEFSEKIKNQNQIILLFENQIKELNDIYKKIQEEQQKTVKILKMGKNKENNIVYSNNNNMNYSNSSNFFSWQSFVSGFSYCYSFGRKYMPIEYCYVKEIENRLDDLEEKFFNKNKTYNNTNIYYLED